MILKNQFRLTSILKAGMDVNHERALGRIGRSREGDGSHEAAGSIHVAEGAVRPCSQARASKRL